MRFCIDGRALVETGIAVELALGGAGIDAFGQHSHIKAGALHLHELVDQAVATMPLPEKGERDTRRQRVVRAIQQLGKEKDGPLQVKDNLVIFIIFIYVR